MVYEAAKGSRLCLNCNASFFKLPQAPAPAATAIATGERVQRLLPKPSTRELTRDPRLFELIHASFADGSRQTLDFRTEITDCLFSLGICGVLPCIQKLP